MRPYVRPELTWIAEHHGVFQMICYGHLTGGDRNAHDRFRERPWFDACASSASGTTRTASIPATTRCLASFFEPMVRRVFADPRYLTGDEAI